MILFSAVILGGCQTAKPAENLNENVVEKTGEVRVKTGDEYILATDSGLVNMTSQKINLDNYMKKKIKVTGMFSGSTLYVDKVELVK